MKKTRNQLMYLPTVIFYLVNRKKMRSHYLLFKQLAYDKWYPIQWLLLDGIMQVYPETPTYEPELKDEVKND